MGLLPGGPGTARRVWERAMRPTDYVFAPAGKFDRKPDLILDQNQLARARVAERGSADGIDRLAVLSGLA